MTASRDRVWLLHPLPERTIPPRLELMAQGLVSIGALLEDRGFSPRILRCQRAAEIEETEPPLLIGVSLHFHQAARAAIDLARGLERRFPQTPIVLGGLTASIFAEEILREHPEVDFIIRGDGEVPVLRLAEHLALGTVPLEAVPNLVFRRGAEVRRSPETWSVDADNVRALDFTRFSLLGEGAEVMKLRMEGSAETKSFSFSAGRGCGAACLYCAGGRQAQKRHALRPGPLFYAVDFVVEQLQKAARLGATQWSTCFDPLPDSDHYPRLFTAIRAAGLELRLVFDCFGLPSPAFLAAFARTFAPGSALNLSPETGSPSLRRRIRTYAYDNDALFECLARISDLGLPGSLYFSTGFPFETEQDLDQTRALIRAVRERFPSLHVHVGPIELEPGSPLFEHRRKLGVESPVSTFRALVSSQEAPQPLTYRTRDFSTQAILENHRALEVEARRGELR